MLGIVGLVALLSVLGLSLLITRLATIALGMTGLSEQAAKFQARSAFTGTGFTTTETEQVVQHPVRRRIIMGLMIVRSAGLVTIVISLILSFAGNEGDVETLWRLAAFITGVFILLLLSRSRLVNKILSWVMNKALRRWSDLKVRDYFSLLRLHGDYHVNEIMLKEGDWLVGKKIRQCRLRDEGVLILGLVRDDGTYVGAPRADTEFYPGDTLILYGRAEALRDLDRRRAGGEGDVAHQAAVGAQQRRLAEQQEKEQQHKQKKQEQRG
jgi:MFS family permease